MVAPRVHTCNYQKSGCPIVCSENFDKAAEYFSNPGFQNFILHQISIRDCGSELEWNVQLVLDMFRFDGKTDPISQVRRHLELVYYTANITSVQCLHLRNRKLWMFTCQPKPINISYTARQMYNKMIRNSAAKQKRTIHHQDRNDGLNCYQRSGSIRDDHSNTSGSLKQGSGKSHSPLGKSQKSKRPSAIKDEVTLTKTLMSVITSDSRKKIPLSEAQSDVKPRYLLLGKRNITRRVTGKRHLSRAVLDTIVRVLPCTISECRKQIRDQSTRCSVRSKSIPDRHASVCISPTTDYGMCIAKSKLRDVNTFRVASQFLSLAIANGELKDVSGEPYELNIKPLVDATSISYLRMRHQLRCSGLPTNSSLYNLFQEFCNDIGINEVRKQLIYEVDTIGTVPITYH